MLSTRPVWEDELFTLWAARKSPGELFSLLRLDSGPPLFYLLEKPFVALAELARSDLLARLLPFLATALLFAGARALPRGGARNRFLLLAAASPLLLLYSAEARAYALLGALVFLLFLLTRSEEVRRPSPHASRPALRSSAFGLRSRLGSFGVGGSLRSTSLTPHALGRGLLVGLTAAAALYTHYLALFAVAALALLCFLSSRHRTGLALLAAFALFLPWLPVLVEQPSEALAWSRERPEAAFAAFLSALGGAGRVPAPFGPPLPAPLFFAGLLLGLALVFLLLHRATPGGEARRGALFVILVLAAILLAALWRPLAFAGRSEMVVLPVWLWTISAAGERSRLLRFAIWGTTVIAVAASFFALASPRPAPGPAQAVRLVSSALRPGDRLVAGAGFYLPARLAADRGEINAELRPFPAEVGRHPGWFVPTAPTAEDYAAIARAAGAARARIFFLLPHSYRTPELLEILTTRGTLREVGAGAEGVVMVWEPGIVRR